MLLSVDATRIGTSPNYISYNDTIEPLVFENIGDFEMGGSGFLNNIYSLIEQSPQEKAWGLCRRQFRFIVHSNGMGHINGLDGKEIFLYMNME